MGDSKNQHELYLYKTLISDNGIDRIYRPVLDKEEYEYRKKQREKACIRLMNAQERIQSEGRAKV